MSEAGRVGRRFELAEHFQHEAAGPAEQARALDSQLVKSRGRHLSVEESAELSGEWSGN